MLGLITNIVIAILAGSFLIWDQMKEPKSNRRWRVRMAIFLLALTIVLQFVTFFESNEADRERKADLLLIQKLGTALNSLCFEIELKPQDSGYHEETTLQVQFDLTVDYGLGRVQNEHDWFSMCFRSDSGWYRSEDVVRTWPTIRPNYDSLGETIRFVMSPFGVRSAKDNVLKWKAERVADISLVQFRINVSYDPFRDVQPSPPAALWPQDFGWNPIRRINLYANDFEGPNLVARLIPIEAKGDAPTATWADIVPEYVKPRLGSENAFYVDLSLARKYLLEYSKN